MSTRSGAAAATVHRRFARGHWRRHSVAETGQGIPQASGDDPVILND
ncbi:MAG: hypothetical protein U1F42_01700 [Candidatus Competibacteraceae bacterium]